MQTPLKIQTKLTTEISFEKFQENLFKLKLSLDERDKIKLSEQIGFTTHSGKNLRKVFSPSLKGFIQVNWEQKNLIWNLSIENIILKVILVIVVSMLILKLLTTVGIISSILGSFILGFILMLINVLNLEHRVRNISNQLNENK